MADTTATPEAIAPETEAQTGAKPAPAELTPEQLAARIADLERHAKNKEEEAERNRKKLEKFEQQERERADAQLTKEQLLEKQVAEANQKAERAIIEANGKLLKSAVLLKAQAMNFEHPADAFQLADLSKVEASESGEYDEKSIEAALKPLIGRLPVKTQSAGIGTPKLPPAQPKKNEQKERAFRPPF